MVMVWMVSLLFFPLASQAKEGGIESLRQTSKAFSDVAKRVSPAVVFIQIEKTVQQPNVQFFSPFGQGTPFGDQFFNRFFGMPGPQPPDQSQQAPRQQIIGQGSGFIISKDGYILTNNHVVGDADKVVVKLLDGREFTATTVGADPHSDVAVIKIEADNLPVLQLGNSDDIEVGEWVVAIGNPFGLSHTLTVGVVSAKGRSSIGIADYENFIQTDAAINPGNSGGPLVDLDGKVVGMNTAIFSQSGGYMGIGFAIPINMARSIKDQLIKTGTVVRGYLGVAIQELTPDLAKSFGMNDQKGILVAQVSKDTPAEDAGLKQGDVIIEFDGKSVDQVGAFRNQVALEMPGTRVNVTVLRNGKREQLSVTIGKLPDKETAVAANPHNLEKIGMTVQNITPELAQQFGLEKKKGVIITDVAPGSVAALANVRPGGIILEVNRTPVEDLKAFKKAIADVSENGVVLLLIQEGEYTRYVALKTE
ncbi:MAG: DegQ family serine endoprotease [Deltaproteobacteria bacterium]|nr:DegQ family serine endoprotease [Deltaproteobacteria bacterium]